MKASISLTYAAVRFFFLRQTIQEHLWVTEDLNDPERWRQDTDPSNYQRVQITDDDLKGAVTIIDRIKSRIRKLSVSLTNFTLNRRRSKSNTAASHPSLPPSAPGMDPSHCPCYLVMKIKREAFVFSINSSYLCILRLPPVPNRISISIDITQPYSYHPVTRRDYIAVNSPCCCSTADIHQPGFPSRTLSTFSFI